MYLHIGNGKSVKEEDIIGIFDLDTATVSSITKKFVSAMQRENSVEYTDSDLPRSFVLVSSENKYRLMLSRISAQGLKIRAEGEYSVYE